MTTNAALLSEVRGLIEAGDFEDPMIGRLLATALADAPKSRTLVSLEDQINVALSEAYAEQLLGESEARGKTTALEILDRMEALINSNKNDA